MSTSSSAGVPVTVARQPSRACSPGAIRRPGRAAETFSAPGLAFAEHGPRDLGISYGWREGRADKLPPSEVVAAAGADEGAGDVLPGQRATGERGGADRPWCDDWAVQPPYRNATSEHIARKIRRKVGKPAKK